MTDSAPALRTIAIPEGVISRVFPFPKVTIPPATRMTVLTLARCKVFAVRGLVWTSEKGPLGPTFDLPVENPDTKIGVEILFGTLRENEGFEPDDNPAWGVETLADEREAIWMILSRHAFGPQTRDCAIELSFTNRSAAPVSLPVGGLFLLVEDGDS